MDVAAPPARPELPPMRIEFRPNPNVSFRGGAELLASARTGLDDHAAWTRTRWGIWRLDDAPVVRVEQGGFEDAVRAASELVAAERATTRWGLLGRHQGRVDGVAVLQARGGWDLVRVDMPLDAFVEPVPGAMAPWQRWTVNPMRSVFREGDVRRERADVAALVGATVTLDLRATSPSRPTEPA